MSGIVGSYSRIGIDVSREDVSAMLAALIHRGPDAQALWSDGPAAFGHCALHTTPEAVRATVPYRHESSGVVAVFDARIDNRDELLARLDLRDETATSHGDGSIIVHAYHKWGLESPRHLIGDFAIALWDPRRGRMVLARDVMGVRPLYYFVDPERAYFASEVSALFASGDVPRAVNEKKLSELVVPEYTSAEETCYRGVLRVPRAHVVVIEPGRVRRHRYFRFDTERELQLASDAEYEESFRSLFAEAVRCRLRVPHGSSVPGRDVIATTLSGGLDSSAVTCAARNALDSGLPLHTFSAVFPTMVPLDPHIDERAYIDAVHGTGDFVAHFVEADNPKSLRTLLANQRGDLVSAPNLYMTEALFEACEAASMRVVLSGFDGDVTVSYGYEHLADLARRMEWEHFADEIAAFAARRGVDDVGHYFRQFGAPVLRDLAVRRDLLGFARSVQRVPARVGYSKRRLWRRIGLPAFTSSDSTVDCTETFRERQLKEITHPFMQYLLDQFDMMAARRGIEQRYPFFDRRLVEFCLAMPLEQRFRDGWTRSLLRRAMAPIVPATVLARTRKGTIGVNARVQVAAASTDLGPTNRYAPSVQSYLDPLAVEDARGRLTTDPKGTGERDLFTVFLALSLSHWVGQKNT